MLFSQNILTAFRGLAANKLRSALTILGMVIGVAAVVALMAIGNGATSSITSRIQSNGTNLITVSTARVRGNTGAPAQFGFLKYSDYQVLKSSLANISGISPTYQSQYDVKYGNQSLRMQVVGVTEDYLEVNTGVSLGLGRTLTAGDRNAQSRVAVIGSQTSAEFIPGSEPHQSRHQDQRGEFQSRGCAGAAGYNRPIILTTWFSFHWKRIMPSCSALNAVRDREKVVSSITASTPAAPLVPEAP